MLVEGNILSKIIISYEKITTKILWDSVQLAAHLLFNFFLQMVVNVHRIWQLCKSDNLERERVAFRARSSSADTLGQNLYLSKDHLF